MQSQLAPRGVGRSLLTRAERSTKEAVFQTARHLPVRLRTSRQITREAVVVVRAQQKETELARLIALVRKHRPRTVVEIGTAEGGTFYAWCKVAARDAVVVSIDLPGGPFGGGYPEHELPRLRGYAQPKQTLHFLRKNSHLESTKDELVELLGGAEIDFLMIDGDHTYGGVKRDFELYSPLVRAGGLIAFHDVLPHTVDANCEVDVFWNELRHDYRFVEFLDRREDAVRGQWGGIGVIWKS